MSNLTKKTAILIASNYFPSYPSINTFFITEDAEVFENENAALSHAKSFDAENPVLVGVERGEVAEAGLKPVEEQLAEGKEQLAEETAKEETPAVEEPAKEEKPVVKIPAKAKAAKK